MRQEYQIKFYLFSSWCDGIHKNCAIPFVCSFSASSRKNTICQFIQSLRHSSCPNNVCFCQQIWFSVCLMCYSSSSSSSPLSSSFSSLMWMGQSQTVYSRRIQCVSLATKLKAMMNASNFKFDFINNSITMYGRSLLLWLCGNLTMVWIYPYHHF